MKRGDSTIDTTEIKKDYRRILKQLHANKLDSLEEMDKFLYIYTTYQD